MAESFWARMWEAVKPPPAVKRPGEQPRFNARQKRFLGITCGVLGAAGITWAAYWYISTEPQRAEREFQTGMEWMRPGSYDKAIRYFSSAVSIWPRLANAYFERGVAHNLMGDKDQALQDFERAAGANPAMPQAYAGMGTIFRERGDYQRAIEEYTKSLEIQGNLDAYFERGQTYESMGQYQKAIDDFDQAIAEERDAPAVYRARALARRNLGDEAGYEQDRQKALSIEVR